MSMEDLFDGFDPRQHEAEARERWGTTTSYTLAQRRTARRSCSGRRRGSGNARFPTPAGLRRVPHSRHVKIPPAGVGPNLSARRSAPPPSYANCVRKSEGQRALKRRVQPCRRMAAIIEQRPTRSTDSARCRECRISASIARNAPGNPASHRSTRDNLHHRRRPTGKHVARRVWRNSSSQLPDGRH